MKKLNFKFDKLISEYEALKDSTLSTHLDRLYDGALYDIQGYCEDMDEANELEDIEYITTIVTNLESQVKAFRVLIKGYDKINFIYC